MLSMRIALVIATFSFAVSSRAADPKIEFFENKIRPILVGCQTCHNAAKEKGGLRLTSRAELLKGGDTGPSLDVANFEKSLLLQVVQYDGDIKMPPKGKLSDSQIAELKAWVKAGAVWPDDRAVIASSIAKEMDVRTLAAGHWSFRPIANPTAPIANIANPIDSFLRAKLDAAGLKPASPATKRTLIRRLTFDLIGLPPTPAEIDAFLADQSPTAYETCVDRLLASPHYGERWGRHWLDLTRYAETMGHEFDFEIADAWRYRDYAIRAFNADLPYDQFVREQIAGDRLTPRWHPTERTNEALIATGFWHLGEGKHSPVDVRQEQADRIDNMIDVFGKTFLGLTISCARCHDHKFDPLPTRDYYALYGILSSSRYQHAFIDDPAKIDSLLDKLKTARGEVNEPSPAEVAPSKEYANWLANSRSFESFGADWNMRWPTTGHAFRLTDRAPHSGRESSVLRGTLRSPTFKTESRFVSVRVAGRHSRINLILDNFQLIQDPIYGGLRKGIDHGEEYQWVVFDLGMWPNHNAYLELIDDDKGYLSILEARFSDSPPPAAPKRHAKLPKALPELEAKLAEVRRAPAMADGTGLNERVFVRGNHKAPGIMAERCNLELFRKPDAKSPPQGSGRLELANEVTTLANPLFARVYVNRVWHHHFGVGLVPSTDDFGKQGQAPSHSELLDWLATTFANDGWSTKRLHKRILLSDAYRMSSQPHAETAAKAATVDPQNRLLHKANVQRLEAEAIRDAILAVSGQLDRKMGGPSVMPYLTEHMIGRGRPGSSGPLDGSGRRSIYMGVRRNFLNPLFVAFDYPTPFTTIGRRGTSNVPAQALVLLNNPFAIQQAEIWSKATASSPEERVRKMYITAFGRTATEAELSAALAFVAEQTKESSEPQAWADFAHTLFNAKEFLFIE